MGGIVKLACLTPRWSKNSFAVPLCLGGKNKKKRAIVLQVKRNILLHFSVLSEGARYAKAGQKKGIGKQANRQ